nr:uncharacterized protein LOC128691935 isoform X1 [Cherax quadricarinatus]
MKAKKAVEDKIKEYEDLNAKRYIETQQASLPSEEPRYKKVEVMEYRGRPAAVTRKCIPEFEDSHNGRTFTSEYPIPVRENDKVNNDGLKLRGKRMCPKCAGFVAARKYACDCGYNFKEVKEILKRKRNAHLLEMGKKASKNRNLWRAFSAIEKQSIKIQGGGYYFVTLYFKECPTRDNKGIISGNWLKKHEGDLLLELFSKLIKPQNKEEEHLTLAQDRQHNKELPSKDPPHVSINQDVTQDQEH